MALHRYRRVLALPGVRSLVSLMFLARIPATATGMVLTLHVVLTLHRGYGAAGLVGAVGTVGIAVGAPLMGRLVDALGLRPMVLLTTVGEGAFWLSSWLLSYPALLAVAFAGGLLSLPTMSIGRQALAALVPEEHRRTAYSLDSVSVEMSFMVGPAVGVLIATKVSTTAALLAVGGTLLLSGAALYVVDPPMRSDSERAAAGPRPARRDWLRGPLIGVLVALLGGIFVLAGMEVAEVAALRGTGQIGWTGPVTIVMCAASLVGGLVYGSLHRSYPPALLVALLGLLCVPIGLGAGGPWWLLALALIPTNLLCAPSLTAANELISRLAPAAARGEATGLASSASTLGAAAGSPVIGLVVDHTSATGWFVVAGLGGLAVAVVVLLVGRRPRTPAAPAGERTPAAA